MIQWISAILPPSGNTFDPIPLLIKVLQSLQLNHVRAKYRHQGNSFSRKPRLSRKRFQCTFNLKQRQSQSRRQRLAHAFVPAQNLASQSRKGRVKHPWHTAVPTKTLTRYYRRHPTKTGAIPSLRQDEKAISTSLRHSHHLPSHPSHPLPHPRQPQTVVVISFKNSSQSILPK